MGAPSPAHHDPLQTAAAAVSASNSSSTHFMGNLGGGEVDESTVLGCGLSGIVFVIACYALKTAMHKHLYRKVDLGGSDGVGQYVDLDSLDYGLSQGGEGGLSGRARTKLYPERWLMLLLYSLNSPAPLSTRPPGRHKTARTNCATRCGLSSFSLNAAGGSPAWGALDSNKHMGCRRTDTWPPRSVHMLGPRVAASIQPAASDEALRCQGVSARHTHERRRVLDAACDRHVRDALQEVRPAPAPLYRRSCTDDHAQANARLVLLA
jgi:hypothetical protein